MSGWWLLVIGVVVAGLVSGARRRGPGSSPAAAPAPPGPSAWEQLRWSGENGEALLAEARRHDVWTADNRPPPSTLDPGS